MYKRTQNLKAQMTAVSLPTAELELPTHYDEFHDKFLNGMRPYFESLRSYRFRGFGYLGDTMNRTAIFTDGDGTEQFMVEGGIIHFLRYLRHHCKNEDVSELIEKWENVLIALHKDIGEHIATPSDYRDYFSYFPRPVVSKENGLAPSNQAA